MDFTNLVITPVAAITTVVVLLASVLIRPRSEDRSLFLAFAVSLIATTLLTQPWYFTTDAALREGLLALIVLTLLGFALGAFVALVAVKAGRAIKGLIKSRR